jgi:peroxiredoxin family protein
MNAAASGPTVAGSSGTVLLLSGELDKAIAAFEIAAGMAALGMKINMWFLLFGTNCLRKPKPRFSLRRWFHPPPYAGGPGRNPDTDTPLQWLLHALNATGAQQLPLSQLNFAGIGPALLRRIFDHKHISQLDLLIRSCEELGVKFTICQVCVDSMALTPDDFIVDVEIRGVSSYTLQVAESHYNAVF